jgi:phosphopantetheinyl transferase
MHFNLSYSGNYAVLALAHTTVGVDIEPVANDPPAVLPRKIFMPDELFWLEEQLTPERYAFLWTRLESAIKADGRGFGMERRDFSLMESGHPWHLQTLVYDRHIISCALKGELETSLALLSRDELLS